MYRLQRNLQTLGILWLVYAGLRFLTGFMGLAFMRSFGMMHGLGGWRHGHSFPMMGPPWFGVWMPFVGTTILVSTAFALIVGYGLLQRRPWGRILGIIAGVLGLFHFPFGTALGIYTLWVLAPAQSGFEYEAIADRG